MKLYLLTTEGFKDFYVVAENSDEAEKRLGKLLCDADYGYTNKRRVVNIKVLSEEVSLFGGKPKPNFTDINKLILPSSCE